MEDASDREVPIADLVGATATRALWRALRGADSDEERATAAGPWLLARLAEAPRARGTVQRAVELILKARGQTRMDDVARTLGFSRRRLERAFARELGIPPKLYARIVRLNAVLAVLDESERPHAVDLALDAGFFDQAHLLRDFRILAGRTPSASRESDGEMARHFTHPRRLRALFAGE
jgi:transcriptional regulator GlxA family with amidase domain